MKQDSAKTFGSNLEYLGAHIDYLRNLALSGGGHSVQRPPGTGKTMLAHAVAHAAGYRLMLVDFHKVMSCMPHHGLDENLQRVFHEARLQHAILFFDEAGKRP